MRFSCVRTLIVGFTALALVAGCSNNVPTVTQTTSQQPDQQLLDKIVELSVERLPMAKICAFDKALDTAYVVDRNTGEREACGLVSKGWSCLASVLSPEMNGVCYFSPKMEVLKDGKADTDFSSNELIDSAIGECSPPYSTVCADFVGATLDGEPFNGKLFCAPVLVNDEWVTFLVPELCPDDTSCQMGGDAPQFGVCMDLVDCDATTPCPDTGDPCTANTCSEQGTCTEGPVDDTLSMPCDDNNLCTDSDLCVAGMCAGSDIVCDDLEVCTDDSCDVADGQCVFAPNDATLCTDGDLCTTDACVSGICVGTAIDYDDLDPCDGVETCDLATGLPVDGTAPDCDDLEVCTDDFCDASDASADPTTGCVNEVNDANLCTDADACTLDACVSGICEGTAINFDDADACNGLETCEDVGGVPMSVDGTAVDCDDLNVCTDDLCDPSTGACANTNVLDGTLCDTTDPSWICVAGTCTNDFCAIDGEVKCDYNADLVGTLTCDISSGETYGTYTPATCGLTADWWCVDNLGCVAISTVETDACGNGVDDDGDLLVDCDDPDCFSDPLCPTSCESDADCGGNPCTGGVCCTPDCSGKQCGDDGCGGSCGTCPAGSSCNPSDQCVIDTCTPDCSAVDSCGGSDGCSGTCVGASGNCSGAGETCNASGVCVASCTPDCSAVDSCGGSDGCSGTCVGALGNCSGAGETCDAGGQCVATATAHLTIGYTVDFSAIPSNATSVHLMVECQDAGNFPVIGWGSKDSLSPVPTSGTVTLTFDVDADIHHCDKVNVAALDGATAIWWAARHTGFTFVEDGDLSYSYDDGTTTWSVSPTVGTKPNDPTDDSEGENWNFAPGTDTDGDGTLDGSDPCPLDPFDTCG